MLQILIAFLAGVLTIAAPCILPLLPILVGTAVGQKSKTRPLFIVLGFVLVFSAAALSLSYLTDRLGLSANALRIGAVFVLGLFGVFMLWPAPFELLMSKLNGIFNQANQTASSVQPNNLGGFILGATLGLVWTPCAGPVLGSVLALIALQKDLLAGAILLIPYALGAGVPMLLVAYGGQYMSSQVRLFSKYTRVLQQSFGIIIILLAVALYFNYDTKIYAWILQNYPGFNPKF
jgi:cytochrome c biogenesis protein CcdA